MKDTEFFRLKKKMDAMVQDLRLLEGTESKLLKDELFALLKAASGAYSLGFITYREDTGGRE